MILCDTNILIEFYKDNVTVIESLRSIGVNHIAVSVITKAELFYGARNKQEMQRISKHLDLCHGYPITIEVSHLFIELMATYSLSHKPSIPDMLIAATAMIHGIKL